MYLDFEQEMELDDGPIGRSAFKSSAERKRAWELNRQDLLSYQEPGRRPWAWWHYESGAPASLVKGFEQKELKDDPEDWEKNERRLRAEWAREEKYEAKRFAWLDRNGHLSDEERDAA